MICTAVLPSETFAHKAQRILTANGYPSELIRSSSLKEGCAFGVKIVGRPEDIQEVLENAHIPVRSLQSERDGV